MLARRPGRKKAQASAQGGADVRSSADDAELLAALVKDARKALEPLAACEPTCSYSDLLRAHKPMGVENGAGVHLRVANVQLDADGRVTAEVLQRFVTELDEVRESIYTCFNTLLVSMALLLTVLVVLFLAKVEYKEADAAAARSAWDVDAISWLAGGSNNEVGARRICHGFESAIFGLCLLGCLGGIFLAQCQLVVVSALPGNMAMLEYLLQGGLKGVFTIYMCVDLPFVLAPIGIALTAARHSPVAFLTSIVIVIGCYVLWGTALIAGPSGMLMVQNRTLQRRARAAVARTDAEGWAREGGASCSSTRVV